MRRKHISWKTKCASALMALGRVPYSDAKEMTEDQFLSLFQWDHNILHETGFPEVDLYWNLEPKFIREHREKTKLDAKVIAKTRRLRAKLYAVRNESGRFESYRKIKSRGFDKTLRKKMDGTVVKR